MLLLWSADLEKGKEKEYKDFIRKNIDVYRKRVPTGWKLMGVYGSTFGLGPYDVTWIWKFNKFKDMDAVHEFSDRVLDRLMVEENDFYLPGSSNTVILREIEDWSVVGPKKQRSGKR